MAIEICLSFVSFLKSLFEELIDFLSGIGIFAVVNSLYALIAVGLDAFRIAFSKSKIKETAAAVVGIGLLVGSLSLLAEPVQTGPGGHNTVNVCAPVISSITVHDDGSAGLRVSVDFSHGWDMFTWLPPSLTGLSHWEWYGYKFRTYDAVLHNPLERGDFSEIFSYFSSRWYTSDYKGRDVHFDYFVRGGSGGIRGTGGKYFSMRIEPEWYGLRHVRGEHYHTLDHWVDITLYVTDRDSKGKRMPVGKYNMHCWVSDSDGNGYYVTVYFGGEAFF